MLKPNISNIFLGLQLLSLSAGISTIHLWSDLMRKNVLFHTMLCLQLDLSSITINTIELMFNFWYDLGYDFLRKPVNLYIFELLHRQASNFFEVKLSIRLQNKKICHHESELEIISVKFDPYSIKHITVFDCKSHFHDLFYKK